MGLFSKKSKEKAEGPVAGLKDREIIISVKKKDGTLKSFRKIKNDKVIESFDV